MLRGMTGEKRELAESILRNCLDNTRSPDTWKALACIPATGPTSGLISAFERYTDAPLEFPLFCAFHLISGLLLAKGSIVKGTFGEVSPEVWTIVLAPSGAGKTLFNDLVSQDAPAKDEFPECASASAFFSALKDAIESRGYGLWFQDEFAQILKQIETLGSPLAETKSYLLRAYSNETINRTTKKDGKLVIEKPKLGILALNTRASFINAISAESMLDGFAQRFAVVFADEDLDRPMANYALYDLAPLREEIAKFWEAIAGVETHAVYAIEQDAIDLYKQKFREFFKDQSRGFYRRIMFRAFKYAMLYHILSADSSSTLTKGDMELSLRLVKLHLEDTNRFLGMKQGLGEFIEAMEVAKKAIWKARTKDPAISDSDLTRKLQKNHPDYFADSKEANYFVKFFSLNPAQREKYRNLGVERAKDF